MRFVEDGSLHLSVDGGVATVGNLQLSQLGFPGRLLNLNKNKQNATTQHVITVRVTFAICFTLGGRRMAHSTSQPNATTYLVLEHLHSRTRLAVEFVRHHASFMQGVYGLHPMGEGELHLSEVSESNLNSTTSGDIQIFTIHEKNSWSSRFERGSKDGVEI